MTALSHLRLNVPPSKALRKKGLLPTCSDLLTLLAPSEMQNLEREKLSSRPFQRTQPGLNVRTRQQGRW
jgi:hypothetical protein